MVAMVGLVCLSIPFDRFCYCPDNELVVSPTAEADESQHGERLKFRIRFAGEQVVWSCFVFRQRIIFDIVIGCVFFYSSGTWDVGLIFK